MSKNKKWSYEARKYVFRRVKSQFGCSDSWECNRCPKGELKNYYKLMESLSSELKNTFDIDVTPMAIDNQIAWAVNRNQNIIHTCGVSTWIHNRSAALEIGLITASRLPKSLIVPKD